MEVNSNNKLYIYVRESSLLVEYEGYKKGERIGRKKKILKDRNFQ